MNRLLLALALTAPLTAIAAPTTFIMEPEDCQLLGDAAKWTATMRDQNIPQEITTRTLVLRFVDDIKKDGKQVADLIPYHLYNVELIYTKLAHFPAPQAAEAVKSGCMLLVNKSMF